MFPLSYRSRSGRFFLRIILIMLIAFSLALQSNEAAQAQELVLGWGDPGNGQGEFSAARGIDINGAGDVFIADRQRNRILQFDVDGNFVDQSPFFFAGSPNITFDQVNDVVVVDNNLYVANEDDNQIVVLDFNFNPQFTFGTPCVAPDIPGQGCVDPDGAGPLEVGDGQFNEVANLAYDPDGRIIAADTGNDRIQVFDLDGNFLFKFGSNGSANGEFEIPGGIAVDTDGNIYVADGFNHRVQVFDASGTFLDSFGSECDIASGTGCVDPDDGGPLQLGDGQFNVPGELTVDHAGNIYVVDAFNDRVQVFDSDFNFTHMIVLPDDAARVAGVALDGMGRVFVTTGNASGTPGTVPFVVGVYEIDTDEDGLLDLWEQAGIDLNKDGEVDLDLPALGADPMHKDIFVEVDFMETRDPDPNALSDVILAFANAPVSNPDGSDGINLHIEVDDQVPFQSELIIWAEFDVLEAVWFGTEEQRIAVNSTSVLNAKNLVYYYAMYINNKCGQLSMTDSTVCVSASGSSGQSDGGQNFVISLGMFTGTRLQESGTLMHELGHSLGLGHGTVSGANCQPNYLSVMSYTYQMSHIPLDGGGTVLDYSRQQLGPLDENALVESAGIGDGDFTVFWSPDDGATTLSDRGDQSLDWNGQTGIELGTVGVDINNLRGSGVSADKCGASPNQAYPGRDDWQSLDYTFRDDGEGDDHPPFEPEDDLTVEDDRDIQRCLQTGFCELPPYEYAAKLICGVQNNPEDMRLASGFYASTINIHNPNDAQVRFFVKLALTYPPEEQAAGEIVPDGIYSLRYDEALSVDCNSVRRSLFGGELPASYIEGFIVIQSQQSLDVTGVYTTSGVTRSGKPTGSPSIDVEPIAERIREAAADLEVVKTVDLPRSVNSTNVVHYTVQVTNDGPSPAESVVVTDTLAVQPGALVAVIENSFTATHGTGWVIQNQSPSGMTLEAAIPELAVGESAVFEFNVIVMLDPNQLAAHLVNTAEVESATADLNPSNNQSVVDSQLRLRIPG